MADIDVAAQAQEHGLDHSILEHDATARWLGLTVEHLAPGEATIAMMLRPEMLNGFSMAHGGMVFAFADTAFALACNPSAASLSDMELITVASGADISFISSALPGETLRAVAGHRASAGRSGVYDVEVTASSPDGSSRVIAEFRGRSRAVPNPAFRSRS
ncbi:hotdog fold thioesterase [Arthrobacter gengyunqii]|uniref:Hotdog fold thioesterase n=1 Tax=Arthrobacter gengyunqii TaxID=2886940 RepID=A0A9X1LZU0_9MICC|nr:hotdog fold thioesterase [Arthrobacter gengyunqii]MCC3265614.1 hotdog fold thioesterase [Arthrobacter gengyunqii]MCC3268352.1 hotdog fold thioesterase [Arthrobacter gengyunqii]UOY95750.1 hotdog fold thioesterase [Arthrobacter gengyunqii]